MLRYECTDPEFTGNFVEYSSAWSLREVNAIVASPLAETIGLAARKVTALHIERMTGDPITDPAELTDSELEDVDLRLYYWLAGTFAKVTGDVGKLGEALRRTLFDSSAATTDGAPPAA